SSDQVLPAASFRRKSVIFCGAESICTPVASKATKGRTQRANRGMARTSDGIAVIRPLYPKSQGAVSAVGQDSNLDTGRVKIGILTHGVTTRPRQTWHRPAPHRARPG